MGASGKLRLAEVRHVFEIVGECRELGYDPPAWRRHLARSTRRLVGDNFTIVGEFSLTPAPGPGFLAIDDNGWTGAGSHAGYEDWNRFVRGAPIDYHPAANRLMTSPGLRRTRSRRELMHDREWYADPFHEQWLRPNGVDDAVYTFHLMPGGTGLALSPNRFRTDRPFTPREIRATRLLVYEIGRHLGRSISGVHDPVGRLSPRLRATLDCLLDGDGEKQAALRMGIRPATVREYVQALYRHFGVESRSELMAYFLRRMRPKAGP